MKIKIILGWTAGLLMGLLSMVPGVRAQDGDPDTSTITGTSPAGTPYDPNSLEERERRRNYETDKSSEPRGKKMGERRGEPTPIPTPVVTPSPEYPIPSDQGNQGVGTPPTDTEPKYPEGPGHENENGSGSRNY